MFSTYQVFIKYFLKQEKYILKCFSCVIKLLNHNMNSY